MPNNHHEANDYNSLPNHYALPNNNDAANAYHNSNYHS
jgi:hypothetical protein